MAGRLGMTSKPYLFLSEREYLFVASKLTGKREGKSLETENCYLYRFRDVKIVEGRNIPTDQYAFERAPP
jgi:ketosteroid isomerase-like protein